MNATCDDADVRHSACVFLARRSVFAAVQKLVSSAAVDRIQIDDTVGLASLARLARWASLHIEDHRSLAPIAVSEAAGVAEAVEG